MGDAVLDNDDLATAFGKVAVVMGGRSAEREISLKSGQAVLSALRRRGIDAHAVDAEADGVLARLAREAYERVFLILHGRGGEDGVMQGALETLGLPYTGSGVLGSALGMDKIRCKQLWQGAGLPTPPFMLLRSAEDLDVALDQIGMPMMVKPAHEGSSLGMSKVDEAGQLRAAWELAREFDGEVFAERWITGAEFTASILDGEALPLIKLETPHAFYDYEAKYSADSTRYLCPCGLPPAQEAAFQELALLAFAAVAGSGWGRVDLMTDQVGDPWLIEVNTIPGMTDHSLVPMAARAAGIDFDELVMRILATSLHDAHGTGVTGHA